MFKNQSECQIYKSRKGFGSTFVRGSYESVAVRVLMKLRHPVRRGKVTPVWFGFSSFKKSMCFLINCWGPTVHLA